MEAPVWTWPSAPFSLRLLCFADCSSSVWLQLPAGLAAWLPSRNPVPQALVLLPHCQTPSQTLSGLGLRRLRLCSRDGFCILCGERGTRNKASGSVTHACCRRQNIPLFKKIIKFKWNLRSLLEKESENVQREEIVYGKAHHLFHQGEEVKQIKKKKI